MSWSIIFTDTDEEKIILPYFFISYIYTFNDQPLAPLFPIPPPISVYFI